jgi:hypothetical protein
MPGDALSQPQSQEELRDGTREADPKPAEPKKKGLISEEAFTLSTEVLALMGLDPHHPRAVGSPYTVQGWFNGGPRFAGECLSANPQIFRGRFASVRHFFIAHLGTLIEVAQAGSFHGRDVHKHVLAAVVGLNKSISFSCIEPLHNTCRHVSHSLEKQ